MYLTFDLVFSPAKWYDGCNRGCVVKRQGCAVNLVAFLLASAPSILAVTYSSPAQSGPNGIGSVGEKRRNSSYIDRIE